MTQQMLNIMGLTLTAIALFLFLRWLIGRNVRWRRRVMELHTVERAMPPPPPFPEAQQKTAARAHLGTERKVGGLRTGEVTELATAGGRLGARIIDVVFALGVVFVGGLIDNAFDSATLAIWATLALLAAYEVGFVAVKGQTLGKMAMRIRVVRADDGNPPGWGRAALRWFLPAIGYVAMFLPGVVIHASFLWGPHRQGWHDWVARTLVVRE